MINNFIEKHFDTRACLVLLFFIGLLTILISNYLYTYEVSLSQLDAKFYILMSNDLKNYFYVYKEVALRIFPSFLVYLINFFLNIYIFNSYSILSYLAFIFLLVKTFFFFQKFNIKSYIALSSVLILYFFHNSVVYLVFNTYQLLDILLYIFSIFIIESSIFNKRNYMFIFSILAIFTKEFLVLLVIFSYLNNFYLYKKINIFYDLFLIISTFLLHFYFAGLFNNQPFILNKNSISIDLSHYFKLIYNCLFLDKNFFFFMPYILIFFFSRKIFIFLKKYYFIVCYSLIPIIPSIFMYNLVGNNFFRVYYQGYFILIIFILIFLIKKISNDKFLLNCYFFLPITLFIDFIYIFLNIKQSGFYSYYQLLRYEFFSGYYFFSIIFIYILFISYKKKII